jgi:antiviral helicase SKI2
MHKIVDSRGRFLSDGYKSAGDSLRRKQEKEREAAGLPPLTRTGGRGLPARGGAKSLPNGRGGPPGRGGSARGAATPARARGGGVTHFGATRSFGGQQDKQMWNQIVTSLRKSDLLPVVAFTFSKKRCEENATSLSSLDLCVASEKSEVHITVERALTRLKGGHMALSLMEVLVKLNAIA